MQAIATKKINFIKFLLSKYHLDQDALNSTVFTYFLEHLKTHRTAINMIELGCGTGNFYRIFKTKTTIPVNYIGVDIDKLACDYFKKDFPTLSINHSDLFAFLKNHTFHNNTYIVCANLIDLFNVNYILNYFSSFPISGIYLPFNYTGKINIYSYEFKQFQRNILHHYNQSMVRPTNNKLNSSGPYCVKDIKKFCKETKRNYFSGSSDYKKLKSNVDIDYWNQICTYIYQEAKNKFQISELNQWYHYITTLLNEHKCDLEIGQEDIFIPINTKKIVQK